MVLEPEHPLAAFRQLRRVNGVHVDRPLAPALQAPVACVTEVFKRRDEEAGATAAPVLMFLSTSRESLHLYEA